MTYTKDDIDLGELKGKESGLDSNYSSDIIKQFLADKLNEIEKEKGKIVDYQDEYGKFNDGLEKAKEIIKKVKNE